MIDAIDHVNIVVENLELCVQFYRDVLRLPVTMKAKLEGDWIEAVVGLKNVEASCVYLQPENGPRIELLKYHLPAGMAVPGQSLANTLGIRHIAFRVDDIHAEYNRLLEAGINFVGPPVSVPGSVVKHSRGNKWLCYFHDPEGVLLEICSYQ